MIICWYGGSGYRCGDDERSYGGWRCGVVLVEVMVFLSVVVKVTVVVLMVVIETDDSIG